jgi:hypothetical protein
MNDSSVRKNASQLDLTSLTIDKLFPEKLNTSLAKLSEVKTKTRPREISPNSDIINPILY